MTWTKRQEQRRRYRQKHAAKIAEYNRTRRLASLGRHIDYGLKTKGFSIALCADIAESQGGACAICATIFSELPTYAVHADHDHFTGLPRGLLCSGCNVGLGSFRDDPDRLKAAIEYLARPPRPG